MLVTNDHVDPGILNELSSNELFLSKCPSMQMTRSGMTFAWRPSVP